LKVEETTPHGSREGPRKGMTRQHGRAKRTVGFRASETQTQGSQDRGVTEDKSSKEYRCWHQFFSLLPTKRGGRRDWKKGGNRQIEKENVQSGSQKIQLENGRPGRKAMKTKTLDLACSKSGVFLGKKERHPRAGGKARQQML